MLARVSRLFLQRIDCLTPAFWMSALGGYLVGLSCPQLMIAALSLAGVRIGQATAAVVLVLSVLAGIAAWRALCVPFEDVAQEEGKHSDPNPALVLALIFPVLVYCLLWIFAIVLPDRSWDGMAYHLPTLHFWTQHGHVAWIDPGFTESPFMNGWPKAAEVIAYAVVTATGADALSNTVNLFFLPLGILAIATTAFCLGASGRYSLLCGLLLVLVPVNMSQSLTTYVDTSYACVAMALSATVVYGVVGSSLGSLALVVPLGCAGGLAIGAKGSGLAAWAISIAMIVLTGILLERHVPRNRSRVGAVLLLSLFLAFVLGGFWYVRNYAVTQRPLYPLGLKIAGLKLLPGADLDANFQRSHIPLEMRELSAPGRVLMAWAQSMQACPSASEKCAPGLGGLGWMWLLGAVPAILAAVVRGIRSSPSRRSVGFAVLFTCVLLAFAVTPFNWSARYTVWLYGLGLPCAALVLSRPPSWRIRKLTALWVALVACVVLAETLCMLRHLSYDVVSYSITNWAGTRFELRRHKPWEGYLRITDPLLMRILDSDDGAAVGPLTGPRPPLLGQLCFPIGVRTIRPVGTSTGSADLLTVKRENIRWLIWDSTVALPEALARSGLRPRSVGSGLLLYDLCRWNPRRPERPKPETRALEK